MTRLVNRLANPNVNSNITARCWAWMIWHWWGIIAFSDLLFLGRYYRRLFRWYKREYMTEAGTDLRYIQKFPDHIIIDTT